MASTTPPEDTAGNPDTLDQASDPAAQESERRRRTAEAAYHIALDYGFPPDREEEHWYEAERQLGYSK